MRGEGEGAGGFSRRAPTAHTADTDCALQGCATRVRLARAGPKAAQLEAGEVVLGRRGWGAHLKSSGSAAQAHTPAAAE